MIARSLRCAISVPTTTWVLCGLDPLRWTVCLGCQSSGVVVGFEIGRTAVIERGVPPEAVVEPFDVLKDGRPGVLASRPDGAVNQLGLQRGEEALGSRIVPASARAADAGANAVAGEHADVGGAQILTASVRMVDESNCWLTAGQRHVERVRGQLGAEMVGEGPAHHAPAECIQNDRQV